MTPRRSDARHKVGPHSLESLPMTHIITSSSEYIHTAVRYDNMNFQEMHCNIVSLDCQIHKTMKAPQHSRAIGATLLHHPGKT